ncbi:MAG: GNAT family N-acetyltransferase [Rhodobacteraceae bacterium]|nr:GNAT family N-acetyltransferase [Paracoccaceae bacterium]
MVREKGESLPDWAPPQAPAGEVLRGHYAVLEPLDADRHTADLYAANCTDTKGAIWDYMPYGPFSSQASYHKWVRGMAGQDDPFFYAIKNLETGRFCGVASYLRIKPAGGSIEVGHINFAPPLQRTKAATEAMYLMMKWAFGAGYRRYEWKCDALNIRSRRAGQRLGLSYEGVFRQATVVKGRNRDTAWLAAIDKEWPALQAAFAAWLAPSNFDADGRQVESLADLTGLVRVADDPAV